MSWLETSEVVFGLVLQQKISLPNPEYFAPPYNDAANTYKNGLTTPEGLIKKFGLTAINSAHQRANDLNGLGETTDWNDVLENSYYQWQESDLHDLYAKQRRRGEEVDYAPLRDIMDRANRGNRLVRASDVEPGDIDLQPCGFHPFDRWLGGVANHGSNLFLGYPKSGKTQLAIRLSGRMLFTHQDTNGLYVTTEMIDRQLKQRAVDMGEAEYLDRLYIVEHEKGVDEIYNLADRVDNLGFIVVDLVDDLALGEVTEPRMSHIHQTLAKIGRKFRVPVLAFGQPTTAGRTIRPHMARWSRTMAAARASMVFSIYNPEKPYTSKGEKDLTGRLPRKRDTAWIFSWICRGKLTPLWGDEVQKEELEKRYPSAIPVYCTSKDWWNGNVNLKVKFPPSIAELEQGF